MPHFHPWSFRRSAQLCFLIFAVLLFFPRVGVAQAPPRPGQPYAEAALCARADVIFCEDFDYPENFYYSGNVEANETNWLNPGLTTGAFGYLYGAGGRRINPASQYPAPPPGSPASGYVWVANWDPNQGPQGDGATWGKLREPGGNYANGSAPANDVYIRFQYYVTANYAWPGDPRPDSYNFGSPTFPTDNKIFFIYPPEGVDNPTGSAYDAGLFTSFSVYDPSTNSRFADALVARYGDASDNYKFFPLDANATYDPQHMEYGPFASLALRDPGQSPTAGKIFRFDTNRWYTLEFHYKLSSAPGVFDGGVEVWVDGTRVYSAFDLATCGSGLGDCSGIGGIYLGAYHNATDTTAWNGQQVVDNLVIARSYIGPPGQASQSGAAAGSVATPSTPATPSVPSAPTSPAIDAMRQAVIQAYGAVAQTWGDDVIQAIYPSVAGGS